jgi:dihydroneopterin aldolase
VAQFATEDELGVLGPGIQALVASRHYNLQETLIDEILALCLSFPQVSGARVSTQKPDVYPDCKTVGIETEAWRS